MDDESGRRQTGQHLHSTASIVEAELRKRGITFNRHSVLHGRQLILATGEIVNVYPDGAISVTGTDSELAHALSGLDARPPRFQLGRWR